LNTGQHVDQESFVELDNIALYIKYENRSKSDYIIRDKNTFLLNSEFTKGTNGKDYNDIKNNKIIKIKELNHNKK